MFARVAIQSSKSDQLCSIVRHVSSSSSKTTNPKAKKAEPEILDVVTKEEKERAEREAVVAGFGTQLKSPIHEYYEESKLMYGELLVSKKQKPDFIKRYDRVVNSPEAKYAIQQHHEYDVVNYQVYGPRLKTVPEDFRKNFGPASMMDAEQVMYHEDLEELPTSAELFDHGWEPTLPGSPGITPVSKKPTKTKEMDASPTAIKEVPSPRISDKSASDTIQENIIRVPLNAKAVGAIPPKKSPDLSAPKKFAVIPVKALGDLKGMARAPMLNAERPGYSGDPGTTSPIGSLVFQIHPQDLTSLTLTPSVYPPVTTILNVTQTPESRGRLEAWKQRMINEMGDENFALMQKATFADGDSFHHCVESVLRGTNPKDVVVPDKNAAQWRSVQGVFKDISDVVYIEQSVCHPYLCYKGKFDGIVSLEGKLTLIDWKTSNTRKETADALYDNPIQLAAYIGAVNFDEKFADRGLQVDEGAVIVAYNSGEPCSVVRFDSNHMRKYWGAWVKRLQEYWRMVAMDKKLPKRV